MAGTYWAKDSLGGKHELDADSLEAAQKAADALDRKMQREYPLSGIRIVELVG